MKKVLILGTGDAQADALAYLKDLGVETYALSNASTGAGMAWADHFELIDIRDAQAVEGYARTHGVDAVYSTGSEVAMPTACLVSEKLGLPHFVSSQTALLCQNKQQLRHVLGDMPGNLRYREIRAVEDLDGWDTFPAMLKPVDSQGQRGVVRIDSMADFKREFDRSMGFSPSKTLLVEEFVDGPEISVNVFLHDGTLAFYLPSDRYVFEDLPGGIIREHHLPCDFVPSHMDEALRTMVQSTLDKLGIKNGPAYFQIKIAKDGPRLIEVTPRLDGCHMWRLIYHYCGANLMEATFQKLLFGRDVALACNPVGDKSLRFTCQKPGCAFKRDDYDVQGADYLYWYYEDGHTVRSLNGFMEKGGYVIETTKEGRG